MIAKCACGAVQASPRTDPLGSGICHCHDCRTRTGSAFSHNLRFDAGAVEMTGSPRAYARQGDDGGTITYYFCADCGVSVWYTNSGFAQFVMIPAGAFAPGVPMPPKSSVYHDRCADWLQVDVKTIMA